MDLRNKLLQIQKGVKRQRMQIEEDDSDEELNVDQIEENNENEEPARGEGLIQFENGTNQKGGLCLWNEGFRFVRVKGPYWKCSNTDCNSTAKIIEEHEGIKYGTIAKEHNHPPEPPRKEAENRRANAKKRFRAEPGKKQSEILTEARSGASLEVIQNVGNDRAFQMMLFREKKKVFGNVNCRDLLAIELPQELIMMKEDWISMMKKNWILMMKKNWILMMKNRKKSNLLIIPSLLHPTNNSIPFFAHFSDFCSFIPFCFHIFAHQLNHLFIYSIFIPDFNSISRKN